MPDEAIRVEEGDVLSKVDRILDKLVPAPALALVERARHVGFPEKTEREIAVLFMDIEGCTRLCEDLAPRDMNRVIETYFAEYLDIVRGASGDVTEVLGDGLVAIFEAADVKVNVASALAAALRSRARTADLNRQHADRHDPITLNIGLNTGRALTGLTRLRGQSAERWVYSATGPVTNIAARLSALATNGRILTTKATADLLPRGCACEPLGPQRLKNVTGPVEVVEVRFQEL